MTLSRLVLTSLFVGLVACGPAAIPIVPVEAAKLAVTPPGMAVGTALERSVPMTGGKIVSADGRLTIDVPSGALTASQMITVQPISNKGPQGIGVAYRLGPEGQTFAAPVKLTFKYTKADLVGTEPSALRIAYQDKANRWNSIKKVTLDEVAQTVTVETKHFSDWEMYAGWKLTPTSASTAPGKFVALQVKVCSSRTGPDIDEETVALVYTCAPDDDFFTVQEWAVNGTKNGNATVGTVAGSQVKGTAQYLAPPSAPVSNPVAVSASVLEKSGRKTVLASSVWIDAHPPLRGTIASLQVNAAAPDDFYTTTATVAFKWSLANEQYEVSEGTFLARHDQKNPGGATCEIHTSLEGTIGAADGAILLQDGTYFATGRTTGLFTGTTTCTSNNAVEPLTVTDSAVWWPAPQMSAMTPKPEGELEEQLDQVLAYGAKVNVVWSLKPESMAQ